MASRAPYQNCDPELQNGNYKFEENRGLPVYASLTEVSEEDNIEVEKMATIPEYSVVDKALKARSLTPPLISSSNEREMPKQRSLSYSVKPRDLENIDIHVDDMRKSHAAKSPVPFYRPKPYVPQRSTDTDLSDEADAVRSKPQSLSFSFTPYEGDAQITDEEPGYSNPYMNVANAKRSRESRKSSLDSRARFSGILQMTNLNFRNRKESLSKFGQRSSRVVDFIQMKWMSIVAVIFFVIFFVFIIAILVEISRLRQQQQNTPTSSEVEKLFSKYSSSISLNESQISAIDTLLHEFTSKLSLYNASGQSNPSTCGIQSDRCPLCDYCNVGQGERNCTFAKVAELDLLNANDSECPYGFNLIEDQGVRRCQSTNPNSIGGCTSIWYSTNVTYSKVYGRITAYQYGRTNSFNPYRLREGGWNGTIDDPYVDGISITHGMPRQHIWTFAADRVRNDSHCPCGGREDAIPQYVGTDYFCDTGEAQANSLASNNPLWDGEGCDGSYRCCNYNSPPWFFKQLPYPTSDPIELRVCTDQSTNIENIGLESILIYVLS